jgi:hypothetical protein
MMNRKRTSIGLIAGLFLVALASIGIVNGLWSKNLEVHGVVETGDLSIDWTNPRCGELNPWPTGDIQGEYLGKDVGWFEVDINPDDDDPDFGDQVMNITIHNAYPSYFVDCELHWYNSGSIPVRFGGASLTPGDGLNADDCDFIFGTNPPSIQMNCPELTVIFSDGVGQVDPCLPEDILVCRVAHSLEIHVEQPAEQSHCAATGSGNPWQIGGPNAVNGPGDTLGALVCTGTPVSYSFELMLCAHQWNEDASFIECKNSLQHEGPPAGPGNGDFDGDGIPDLTDECDTEDEDGVVDLDDTATDGCPSTPDPP